MAQFADLDKSMQGEKIALPFVAPAFNWHRGDQSHAKDTGSGVQHFGGWVTDAPELLDSGLSSAWLGNEWCTASNGTAYEVYASRILHVALIGKRERWSPDQPGGKPRSNVHALAVAATFDAQAKTYTTWSPVVLRCKGLAGKSFNDAISDWKRKTSAFRALMDKDYPAWVFYCTLGTFGTEFKSQSVGQGNTKSFITPISLYMPEGDKFTAQWLQGRFVGDEVADHMLSLYDQAQDWLHAWNNEPDESQPAQQRPAQPAQQRPAQPPASSEEFPF